MRARDQLEIFVLREEFCQHAEPVTDLGIAGVVTGLRQTLVLVETIAPRLQKRAQVMKHAVFALPIVGGSRW